MYKILITLAAFLGLVSPAPGQLHLHARLGKHLRVGFDVGHRVFHGQRIHHRGTRLHLHHGHRYAVRERYWQPGYFARRQVPAQYGWIESCGRRVWGVVVPAHLTSYWVPGAWVYRTRYRRSGH